MTEVSHQPWGNTEDGSEVALWTLRSGGLTVQLTNYGARFISMEAPDRTGARANVNLCFPSFEPYLGKNFFFGATCGRVANRIAGGRFTLDGREYNVPVQVNGVHALHGGALGFDRYVWNARTLEGGVELSMRSPDGDQGFPGAVDVRLGITLEDATIRMETQATTDAPTLLNLTNHAYFNLSGEGTPSVLDHEVMLHADAFTPTDATQIPTGEMRSVEGTPFDFRSPHRVGERIADEEEQLRAAGGYDHNFAVRGPAGTLRPVAEVYEPASGRVLEVASTEPGVQFYSGNFLNGTPVGPSGRAYGRRSALCLETQGFPDAIHHANFPSVVLRPGRLYESTTTWRFSARETLRS